MKKYSLAQYWSIRHQCRERKETNVTYVHIAKVVSGLGHGKVNPDDVIELDKENKWSDYGFGVTTGVTTEERSFLLKNKS